MTVQKKQKVKQYELVQNVARIIEDVDLYKLKQLKIKYEENLKTKFIDSLNNIHNFQIMRDNFEIIENIFQRDVYVITGETPV